MVQPGSKLSINAVEGYPLDAFSPDVRGAVLMLERDIETGSCSPFD